MGYVLINDPQSITSSRDDKAVMDLAKRPQIAQRMEAVGKIQAIGQMIQGSVCIGNPAHGDGKIPFGRGITQRSRGRERSCRNANLRKIVCGRSGERLSRFFRFSTNRSRLAVNSENGSSAARCGVWICLGERMGSGDRGAGMLDTGLLSISVLRIASRTKSCTAALWRKRTSVFDGCTFTSTSEASQFRNKRAKG